METPTQPPLIARLCSISSDWAEANDVKVSRLGRVVINDGAAIQRLEEGGDLGTVNLGRFAKFLSDPKNWPGGRVPKSAKVFDRDVRREVSA
ncbi:MAG: hypothetical protein AAGB23_05370 [Pseudomonadota bacterium]